MGYSFLYTHSVKQNSSQPDCHNEKMLGDVDTNSVILMSAFFKRCKDPGCFLREDTRGIFWG